MATVRSNPSASAGTCHCAAPRSISPTTARPLNAKPGPGSGTTARGGSGGTEAAHVVTTGHRGRWDRGGGRRLRQVAPGCPNGASARVASGRRRREPFGGVRIAYTSNSVTSSSGSAESTQAEVPRNQLNWLTWSRVDRRGHPTRARPAPAAVVARRCQHGPGGEREHGRRLDAAALR